MARPLIYTPERGSALTLDDLTEFIAEARANGWPGSATPRVMGAIEVNFAHGPRAARITLVPGEQAEA